MPRRFLAPVTSRVTDPTVDRILRNHDERIRELAEVARAAGRRWRVWPGSVFRAGPTAPWTTTQGKFVATGTTGAVWPFENVAGERLLGARALVKGTSVGSIAFGLRRVSTSGGSASAVGGRKSNLTTEMEVLSVDTDCRIDDLGLDPLEIVMFTMDNGDFVSAVAVETEPV